MRLVFIDSCAVNRFAGLNLDPTQAVDGSEFVVAYTPDLAAEYRQGLGAAFVEPHIKRLLRILLERGRPIAAPGTDDVRFRGTDVELVRLSLSQIVITLDTKPPWTRATDNPGLLPWREVEADLRKDIPFVAILRSRARGLPD